MINVKKEILTNQLIIMQVLYNLGMNTSTKLELKNRIELTKGMIDRLV